MGRAFFRSLQSTDPETPVTVVDPDPNTTEPEVSRVLIQAAESAHDTMRRSVLLYATFVAGTTPSFDGQLWIKDAVNAWIQFGAAITTLNAAIQTVADVPAGFDVFFQVTAINGTPTSGIPRLLAA